MCELGEDVDIAERSVPLIAEDLGRNRKFADLYGSFSVKFFCCGSLFGAERPFLVPSPAIRFAERAERCQGTEMLAQLSGLPLSVACVFAAP